jgi:predicted ABC-type ATPase
MPELIIIAGPNGAGKTTFATEYLSTEFAGVPFVNADEIERALRAADPHASEIAAAREMLVQIEALIRAGQSLAIETTLASLSYARKIPEWRAAGYVVRLIYVRLPNVEASLARVRHRVASGGHDIPEATIRRRFGRSRDYLENRYKSLVDEWRIYDSIDGSFRLAESWDDR